MSAPAQSYADGAAKLGWRARIRNTARSIFQEGLEPGPAAGAVFIGVFFAIVPIYGFQAIAAAALATALRLNRPLTLAATFLNIPPTQPFLVAASVAAGHYVRTGQRLPLEWSNLNAASLSGHLLSWAVGSVVVGAVCGAFSAAAIWTGLTLHRRLRAGGDRSVLAGRLFANCPGRARRFAYWKLRLDRMFDAIDPASLGEGPFADIGCGYGITLAWVAVDRPGVRLFGCDLDPERVRAARIALAPWAAEIETADMRQYRIPPAGTILLFDVLQFLDAEEQFEVLRRCCRALLPGGRIVLRVHRSGNRGRARTTLLFDKLIFWTSGCRRRPVILPACAYRDVFEAGGLRVEETPLTNRLPLAHIIFRAVKPEAPER